MTALGNLAAFFGSPEVQGKDTHVTINATLDEEPFDTAEIGAYFDRVAELPGGHDRARRATARDRSREMYGCGEGGT
jgi:hypothetical protein